MLSEPATSPALWTPALLALLDAPTRQAIDRRVDDVSRALGVEIRADELLRVDGLDPSSRFTQLDLQSSDGVKVSFGRAGTAEGVMPEPVVWKVVAEGQGLKLSLGELPPSADSGAGR